MSDDKFRMVPTPDKASDSLIEKLFEGEFQIAKSVNSAFERLTDIMHKPPEKPLWDDGPVLPTLVPELFFSTDKRHGYVFEKVPYGHDVGWRCYEASRYDGDPADGDTTCGYGKTQDEAYVDYLNAREDEKPVPRTGRVVNLGNPENPPEVIDEPYRDPDDIDFDSGLEDDPR